MGLLLKTVGLALLGVILLLMVIIMMVRTLNKSLQSLHANSRALRAGTRAWLNANFGWIRPRASSEVEQVWQTLDEAMRALEASGIRSRQTSRLRHAHSLLRDLLVTMRTQTVTDEAKASYIHVTQKVTQDVNRLLDDHTHTVSDDLTSTLDILTYQLR